MKIKKKPWLFLSLILIIFLAGGYYIYNLNTNRDKKVDPKIKRGEPVSIFVTSDIHYLPDSINDHGEAFQRFVSLGDGKQTDYIEQITDAFINDIKKSKPQFLIISGDLTSNGEKASHEELIKKLHKIEELGTSVYVIPGNHDILNPNARSFRGEDQYKTDYITNIEFPKLYKDFGYDEAVSRDKKTLSYLVAPTEDTWFLMLDTAKYMNNIKNGSPEVGGQITKETFEWIKKCSDLAKAHNAKLITVMHHNLMDHSGVVKKDYTLDNSKDAIDEFTKDGINLVLTGHIHIQNINSAQDNNTKIYDIATSSLAVYPQQYGIINYDKEKEYDYSTKSVDVEAYAKENGLKDKNLINFKSYSEGYFGDKAYDRAYENLASSGQYTVEEIKAMSNIMRIVNLNYFAGTEYKIGDEIKNTEGFKLWEKDTSMFQRNYILSIINGKKEDNTHLHIEK
ncbi:metallophosphoesterase [Clostridium sp. YIM B02551]|uniref:metallophosphoesterase n=1 Tax=Clostridium sp. YIM B02551 TaxID=2910679 RepID=UPI001EEC68D8|nr:metallophosphoesterase [Clostridium sp. YIM B02551]